MSFALDDVLPLALFDVRRVPAGFSRGVTQRRRSNEAVCDRCNLVLQSLNELYNCRDEGRSCTAPSSAQGQVLKSVVKAVRDFKKPLNVPRSEEAARELLRTEVGYGCSEPTTVEPFCLDCFPASRAENSCEFAGGVE